jgi:hypothetical protein
MSSRAAKPMTVLTPLKPYREHWLHLVFRIRPRTTGKLAKMAFIHAAHWAELERLPRFDGQPREAPMPRYLVFVSNFNGPARDYIEAFCARIPGSISLIYGNCSAFPGAKKAAELASYLNRHRHDPDLYYLAYPEATTRMIHSAQRLQPGLRDLAASATTATPAQFRAAWDAFVRTVQDDL